MVQNVVRTDQDLKRCYMVAGGKYFEGTTNGPADVAHFLSLADGALPIDLQMRAVSPAPGAFPYK
jgi:hypothetical protein